MCKILIDKYLGQEALALQNKNILGHSLSPPPPPHIGVNATLPVASATSKRKIVCPQMTQELPKKHHEAGQLQQLPTVGLSQIDCRHT